MVKTNIMQQTSCRSIVEQHGCFSLLEYQRDISVSQSTAISEYYAAQMGVHKRQVIANLNGNGIIVQAGAMQWIAGNVDAATNIKGAGDLNRQVFTADWPGRNAKEVVSA